jgi:SH3-like domain-containing protein
VESGLRLRSAPTTASDTVAIEPPGANLRLTEPVEVALPKIGVYDQWIKVRDGQGREGYVAAWYVEAGPIVAGDQDPPPADSGPGQSEPTQPTPEPPPTTVPVPQPVTLTVFVSQSVGPSGLRLRKSPSLGGALVAVEKAGTALTTLEPEAQARPKIGVKGKWIQVSDSKRLQGYVAAEYVELGPEPPADTSGPIVEAVTVYVTGAAAAGLRLRSAPTTKATTLKILSPNTPLTLLEGTIDLVGAYNNWLKVRDPDGAQGFVAAWYLRK